MDFNNFTIKSQEAVQKGVEYVKGLNQQAIEQVHLLHGVRDVGENVTTFLLHIFVITITT